MQKTTTGPHESLDARARSSLWTRRAVIRSGILGAGALAASGGLLGCGGSSNSCRKPTVSGRSNLANLGPLGTPDVNGVRLPAGFTSRIVARTGETPLAGGANPWHGSPDGGATFPMCDGGWIYVSNSEIPGEAGGCGALRFAADGTLIDAYPILEGTNFNCGGGATPWGTWLSCEEDFAEQRGQIFECDPEGAEVARPRPAMGRFVHEAVAFAPLDETFYMTEDAIGGGFYRFRPSGAATNLEAGTLEIAEVTGGETGSVVWYEIPDPSAAETLTRDQVEASSSFHGGEGIWHNDGVVYFATKFDNRVWAYDLAAEAISILYDDDTAANPILTGVDNLTGTPEGDVLVAEDGGDMEIVAITPDGTTLPLIQVIGHDDSEITGPAFDPSGTRLYFSSQRGLMGGDFFSGGITFEVSGPFVI
jgi:hypothetical protein